MCQHLGSLIHRVLRHLGNGVFLICARLHAPNQGAVQDQVTALSAKTLLQNLLLVQYFLGERRAWERAGKLARPIQTCGVPSPLKAIVQDKWRVALRRLGEDKRAAEHQERLGFRLRPGDGRRIVHRKRVTPDIFPIVIGHLIDDQRHGKGHPLRIGLQTGTTFGFMGGRNDLIFVGKWLSRP